MSIKISPNPKHRSLFTEKFANKFARYTRYREWAGATYRWLKKLWKAGLSAETGICLLPACRVTSDPKGYEGNSSWTELVDGAHKLTAEELEKLNEDHRANYK